MSVKYGILTILSQSPKYRYDIKTTLENMMHQQWNLNPGQVYSTIERLIRDELVLEDVSNENDLKMYRITEKGRQEVEAWLARPNEILPLQDEFFFKILCAQAVNSKLLEKMILQQKENVIKKILHLHHLRKKLEGDSGNAAMVYLIEGGILHLEADMKWMELLSEFKG